MAHVAGSRRLGRGPATPAGEPASTLPASTPPASTPAPAPSAPFPAATATDLVVVGRIGRPQGIKGEVTVEVRTDDPDDRFAVGRVLTTAAGPLTVESSR